MRRDWSAQEMLKWRLLVLVLRLLGGGDLDEETVRWYHIIHGYLKTTRELGCGIMSFNVTQVVFRDDVIEGTRIDRSRWLVFHKIIHSDMSLFPDVVIKVEIIYQNYKVPASLGRSGAQG